MEEHKTVISTFRKFSKRGSSGRNGDKQVLSGKCHEYGSPPGPTITSLPMHDHEPRTRLFAFFPLSALITLVLTRRSPGGFW
jgi:hypothetical protein